MSERHLQRLETGETPISRVMAIALATYYAVSPDDIEKPPRRVKEAAA